MDNWFNMELERAYLHYKTEGTRIKKIEFNQQFLNINNITDTKYRILSSPILFTTVFQFHNDHITSTNRNVPGFGDKIIYT
ncbi:hypothetical protein A3Q56_06059 [Intoshia linei]|uniref:Uncharacterized protein n=1 Tax=Intoshia linei TaxID=1819745 RepID=A0A177AXW7_9BILA|nr:hypothetical protein A3Q56_06059 [Intoshia linei]